MESKVRGGARKCDNGRYPSFVPILRELRIFTPTRVTVSPPGNMIHCYGRSESSGWANLDEFAWDIMFFGLWMDEERGYAPSDIESEAKQKERDSWVDRQETEADEREKTSVLKCSNSEKYAAPAEKIKGGKTHTMRKKNNSSWKDSRVGDEKHLNENGGRGRAEE